MFPFLIGRIRTEYIDALERHLVMFPFLIGRIRTCMLENGDIHEFISFPFLIGRIRTLQVLH